MVCAGEGFVGGRAVADLPVVAEVAGGLRVNLRRAVRECFLHGYHRRERRVAHLHPFRRVARFPCTFRHHDGHGVAHVTYRVDREDGVGRRLVGLAVPVRDYPARR